MFHYIVSITIILIFLMALILYVSLDKKVVYKTLQNKHVVVTGGSSGIGKAAAIEAAKLGANVTIIGRDIAKLKIAVSEIIEHCMDKSEQKIQYAALDVTSKYETISQCLSKLESDVGPIFMLVNCAGTCVCGQFENMKEQDIKMMIDLNYFGTAYPTRYVLKPMKERDEGLIVFVSSEAAFIAFPPDTDTPGFEKEELTKPEETKLISGSGGLHSADVIGKKIIQDAMVNIIGNKHL
ncbi:unnamed protein product [Diatraea saccharalis]|uniref:Uncharacterized protein n=1 Tax=Diatraea saccharalis TaxID=40085 RepID=A0A9P0BZX5_9NEOP|nr:unnamed protein product [Diatraea saccharalis]